MAENRGRVGSILSSALVIDAVNTTASIYELAVVGVWRVSMKRSKKSRVQASDTLRKELSFMIKTRKTTITLLFGLIKVEKTKRSR